MDKLKTTRFTQTFKHERNTYSRKVFRGEIYWREIACGKLMPLDLHRELILERKYLELKEENELAGK